MENSIGSIPSGLSFFCALLSVLVPMLFNLVNRKLHEKGDPDWKKIRKP